MELYTKTFVECIKNRCSNECWLMVIGLNNGETLHVSSEHIEFHDDYLKFDRIVTKSNLGNAGLSGDIPRFARIPYSAITFFTEHSS